MVKGAAGGGHGVRKSSYKRARRARFRVRGDDQIRKDLEDKLNNGTLEVKCPPIVIQEKGSGNKKKGREERYGPVGTINKVILDEDIPGLGRFYCGVCARYFANEHALSCHLKTKKHKRRYKLFYDSKTGELKKGTDIYHTQQQADLAKGRGQTDNGPSLGSSMMEGGTSQQQRMMMSTTTTTKTQISGSDGNDVQHMNSTSEPLDFGEL